jgi:predicted RNase H-like nuclease
MIAGIDGCKGGWLVTKSKCWPCPQRPFLAICESIEAALDFTGDCERVVVDIPIGIPSGARIRFCDLEAQKLLGKGSSRVFLAPPREALVSKQPGEFQSVYRHHRGKGAGLPVWGILPKLNEADRLMTPELQDRIFEFHPELAWKRVAGKLLESKHTKGGLTQRTDIISASVPDLTEVLIWKDKLGKAAAIDDVLDALIGLSVAEDILKNTASRLPEELVEADERGLRMEIWY